MRAALLKLHVSVLLAGFTGVFGKWIQLNEVPLVWWRMLIVVLILYPLLRLRGVYRPLATRRETLTLWGIGGLQMLSWVLFYGSIKASSVSVALVCISLMGFFTAVLSPPMLGTRWSAREFVFSSLAVLGIALIFHFDTHYRLGITLGVLAAAISALLVVCNKKVGHAYDPGLLFYHEIFGGFLLITLFQPLYLHFMPDDLHLPGGWDFFNLFLLAFLCTVGMYTLQLQALARVSAFTVNLTYNLEPIYSIILATLFLGESKDFTPSFYAGLSCILLSVALQTLAVLKERGARSSARLDFSEAV